MDVVYVAQGAADRLATLSFPAGAHVYALCYDRDVTLGYARRTIYDPKCSWAEGRNALAALALSEHPDLDYLIMVDDDVEFLSGSFATFADWVVARRPLLGIPLMPKAERFGAYDRSQAEQQAVVIDEQLVALHCSLISIDGICPLVTRFDGISWTTACLIFEYLLISRFGAQCRQNNGVRVANEGHAGVTGGTLYKAGTGRDSYAAFRQYLKEIRVAYDPRVMFFLRHNKPFLIRKAEQIGRLWRRISAQG
jgi:hypothetical protein